MVEFGLKLEDNKVSDWSEHYIRYEKLKLLLEKCEAAIKRYDEISSRMPDVAFKVKAAYYNGEATPLLLLSSSTPGEGTMMMGLDTVHEMTSRHTSESSFNTMNNNNNYTDTNTRSNVQTTSTTNANMMELMDEESDSREGTGQTSSITTTSSEYGSIINRTIQRARSHVSDYYMIQYIKSIEKVLREIDKHEEEFSECLLADIHHVNVFYKEQLNELIYQVLYLRESVQPCGAPTTSGANPTQQQGGGGGEPAVVVGDGTCAIESMNDSMRQQQQQHRRVYSDASELDQDVLTPLRSTRKTDSTTSPLHIVRKIATWTSKHIHPHHPPLPSTPPTNKQQQQRQHHRESIDAVAPLLTADKINDGDNDNDDDHDHDPNNSTNNETIQQQIRIADSVQRALIEHYRTAKLLQNYVIMNYTGFVKIVKKHDKVVKHNTKEKKGKYNDIIKASNICNEGKDLELLVNRMERLYAAWFCDRNISEARAQLLIKKGDVIFEMDWTQLRLGYRMGMSAVLALWVCWDCVYGMISEGRTTIGGRTAFPVFRGCAGLLQLQWCWGISVWVWTRYRINYIFLFDFDPNIVQNPLQIFNGAVDNTLCFLVCALLYYKAGVHKIPIPSDMILPAGIFPFLLVVYTIYQLVFPLRIRIPMWKTIIQVITSPYTSPSFFHGYVGDIFTSMVKVWQDLVWTIFFVLTGDWLLSEDLILMNNNNNSNNTNDIDNDHESMMHMWSKSDWYTHYLIPLVTLMPLWFRFNQCLRRYFDTGTMCFVLGLVFCFLSVSFFGID